VRGLASSCAAMLNNIRTLERSPMRYKPTAPFAATRGVFESAAVSSSDRASPASNVHSASTALACTRTSSSSNSFPTSETLLLVEAIRNADFERTNVSG